MPTPGVSKLEETKAPRKQMEAAEETSSGSRHSMHYCNSFRISCCTLLAWAKALMPVWLSTWNFARSLVA